METSLGELLTGVHESRLKPKLPTVHGSKVSEEEWCSAIHDKETGKEIYPRETTLARAEKGIG